MTTALATFVVSAATIGWLLGALPQPAARCTRHTENPKLVNRLVDDGAGKVVDNPTPLATERAQAPERTQASEKTPAPEKTQAPERTQTRQLLFGTPAIQQRAAEEEKPSGTRAPSG